MTTNFLDIDGVRLEYTQLVGDGTDKPTLVFLHEGLGSIAMWRDFPQEVVAATGCPALVYSRRGYGQSDALAGPRDVDYMHHEAQRVLPQVLAKLGITNPILIGHSDGASIALIYAGSGLGHLLALALEAPHVFVEDINVTSIAELRDRYASTDLRTKLARHHGGNVDTLFRCWTDVWLRPDFRAWNIEEYLPNMEGPVLVIQGNDDEYGTKRQVEAILSALGHRCDALMLDACRHSPHIDQQRIVLDRMAEFIRGL